MSTSAHEGVYLYDPGDIDADRFVDTAIARDGVLNSALHKADEAAQPVITWCAPPDALWTADNDPWLEPSGVTLVADVWAQFSIRGTYCPKVRSSGTGYRLRVTVGGRSSAGHTCDFAVVVHPRLEGVSAGTFFGEDPVWPTKKYTGVTSTTIAELTADDSNRYLDVPRLVVDRALALERWTTLTDTSGDAITVQAPLLQVTAIGRTANVSSTPELHLLQVAQVIGDT